MLERFERFLSAISEIDRYWHKIAGDEMARYGLSGFFRVKGGLQVGLLDVQRGGHLPHFLLRGGRHADPHALGEVRGTGELFVLRPINFHHGQHRLL